ncbi:MAG: 4-hydroxyphenylacetate 3-hydroxylase N-terminal domain-containing protein [Pseudomonadota bacterium]|nr:4-hydroxyphenylacetate 3-hydroxylase N-terminal domain-containing protein [Pseudomonadota bacterium]
MTIRTGNEYKQGLSDKPRDVWINGEHITNVIDHPIFAASIKEIANIYDLQHNPEFQETMTFRSPSTGELVSSAFLAPRSQEDIIKRSATFKIIANATFGMMGRTQDYLSTMLMSFAESPHLFDKCGPEYTQRLTGYFEYVRENDLFLTHALIPPQSDRSKTSSKQEGDFLHMGVAEETNEGVIIRGARMLATLAPVADELLVYSLPGLKPEDIKHSIMFSIPINSTGLKIICRRPYSTGQHDIFDHPLAARYEESDAVIVFDDVLVPWDRIFIYNDVDASNDLYTKSFVRQHAAHQTAVRGITKMSLAVGTAIHLARSIKIDQFLGVQEKLGKCISALEIIKGCLLAAESNVVTNEKGQAYCALEPLLAIRNFMPRAYPEVIDILRELGAGGLTMNPSKSDLDSAEIGSDILKYYAGAGDISTPERLSLFNLAWDLTGDAFGIRQLQYERYYSGDPMRNLANTYLGYKGDECLSLVAEALESTRNG